MKKATIIIAIVALAFVLIVVIGKWYVKKPMTNASSSPATNMQIQDHILMIDPDKWGVGNI